MAFPGTFTSRFAEASNANRTDYDSGAWSGTVTASNGNLLLAVAASGGSGAITAPSMTGGGLTWTLRERIANVDDRDLCLFSAVSDGGAAFTPDVAYPETRIGCVLHIDEVTQVDTTTNDGIVQDGNDSGDPVEALTVTLAAFGTDAAGYGGLYLTWEDTTAIAPANSYIEIAETAGDGTTGKIQTEYKLTDSDPSWSWSGDESALAVGCEIKAASGGAQTLQGVLASDPMTAATGRLTTPSAGGPVLFDAVAEHKPGQIGDTSWTHTPVGTPTAGVVFAFYRGNTDGNSEVDGITWGGNAMTLAARIDNNGVTVGGSVDRWAEVWKISGPLGGAQTLAVDFNASTPRRTKYVSVSVTGSLSASAFGTAVADSPAGSVTETDDITLTSETDGLCVDGLMGGAAGEDYTADGGQTERNDSDLSGGSSPGRGCVSTEPGAASVVMGWSWTTSEEYAHVGIPIKPGVVSGATQAVISEGAGSDDLNIVLSVDTHDDAEVDHSDLHRETFPLFTPSAGNLIQNNITPSQGDSIVDNTANSTVGPDCTIDTHYYVLRDWEDVGETTNVDSNELAVTTYPCRPVNLAEVAVGENWIDVGWDDATGGAYGHRVYVREQGASQWDLLTVVPLDAGVTTYRITAREPGTTYEWTVTAFNLN